MMMRFIWSLRRSLVFHDRQSLQENCNSDDIVDRREADEPPPNRRLCKYCERQQRAERAQIEAQS